MSDSRSIFYDATFTILYIGFAAAMTVLSLALLAMLALDIPFGTPQVSAAVFNLAGWICLPFGPRLYRRVLGHRFSWRANGALGSVVEF